MGLKLFNAIMYTALIFECLPLLIFIFYKINIPFKIKGVLIVFFCNNILTELVNLFISPIFNSFFLVIHIYTLIMGLSLFYLYREILDSKKAKKVILWLSMVFILTAIIQFFYKDGYLHNNTITYTLISLIFLSLSIYYFYTVFFEMKIKKLTDHYIFWINTGFLIYFGTTFYYTLFEDFIRSYDYNIGYYTMPVQMFTNIIYNLILAKGIWIMRRSS